MVFKDRNNQRKERFKKKYFELKIEQGKLKIECR